MTELRRSMIEELQLRGYSERTLQAYVPARWILIGLRQATKNHAIPP